MKRYGNLFQQIISIENLSYAFDKATKGKKWRDNIKEAIKNKDQIIQSIHKQLKSHTYHTSAYVTKTIYEPKERIIYILPFAPDRIVHHAIMRIVESIFEKKLVYDTYACRIGKGQIKASDRCFQYTKKYSYCLQLDISKFYPSIPHLKLKQFLRTIFKDKELLWLLDDIIDSVEGDRNVPIGNYLSQWFGNLYLSSLDRFCIQHGFSKLVRYCDDLIIFSDSKSALQHFKQLVISFVNNSLSLQLSRADIIKTSKGVKFLGYRHFPTHKLIKKKTAQRIKQRCKSLLANVQKKKITIKKAKGQVASAIGWIKHSNSHNLFVSLGLVKLCKELNVCKDYIVNDVEDFLEPKEQLGINVPIATLINKAVVFYGAKVCLKKHKELLRLHYKIIDIHNRESKYVYVTFTESKRLIYLFNKYKDQLPFTARLIKVNRAYSLISTRRTSMKGYPRHLNTRADYDFVRQNFEKSLWLPDYEALLNSYQEWFFVKHLDAESEGINDATHKVITVTPIDNDGTPTSYDQYELRTNPQARIFELGFSVEEVQQIIKD